jgi:hypothetical protein
MLGQQAISKVADRSCRPWLGRFESKIAFSVQSHRTIVQIRRTNEREPVVHYH